MLFMVLALLLLVFYLLKRFLAARGGDSSRDFIKVLTVHHLSPKEKLVLVNVMDETILIGVTPNQISKIKVMGKPVDLSLVSKDADSGFSDLLSRKLNRSSFGSHKNEPKKNIQDVDKVQDA